MDIGHARVSRRDSQHLDPQFRALTDAGCAMIYQEEALGGHPRCAECFQAGQRMRPGGVCGLVCEAAAYEAKGGMSINPAIA